MSRRDQQDEKTKGYRSRSTVSKAAHRTAKRRANLRARLRSTEQLIAKRSNQLASASARKASLAARLSELADPAESPAVGGRTGPRAYCIKDRLQVAMAGPRSVVIANGRQAIVGTCPGCGSGLVRFGSM